MRIMLVDDSQKIRTYLRNILTRRISHIEQIYECDNGQSAVDDYSKVNPDWVLMDIKLPQMDGIEATKRIMREHPEAKIIIVSQYDNEIYRETAANIGAYDFVTKEKLTDILQLINN